MALVLEGRIAVVTGGGGGIGSAICYRLAHEGMHVILTYNRRKEKAESVAHSLPGQNHLAIYCPVDDSTSQSKLADTIAQKYGTLDILVNNAGITQPIPHADLDALDDALIDSIFRVNVRGGLASVRAMKNLLTRG